MILTILVKVTIVAMAGLIGGWLARGRRAAVRHAVLAAAFAVLLVVLPIASMVVRRLFGFLVPEAQAVFLDAIDAAPSVASSSARTVTPFAIPRRTWPSAGTVLLAGWLCGALFFLLRMMVGLRQVHSLRRFGLPWREGQVTVDRLALDVGVRRQVEVLVHESLAAPVTCGVVLVAFRSDLMLRGWWPSEGTAVSWFSIIVLRAMFPPGAKLTPTDN